MKKNSKSSVVELAHKMNLSANSIIKKINLLKKKDIIQRFYPILNLKKIGYTEYTFILRIDPTYEKELDEFMEYTKKDSRFVIVIKAVGYVNLYYSFLVKDRYELSEVNQKIHSLLGKAVLEEYKIEVDEMIS